LPRSLIFSYGWVNRSLQGLASHYGATYDCHQQAHDTHERLKNARMEEIFQSGLHEFLQDFITGNAKLSHAIATTYNFP